MLVKCSHR